MSTGITPDDVMKKEDRETIEENMNMSDEIAMPDMFVELSQKALDMMNRMREALFTLNSPLALRLNANCDTLGREISKAEARCNAELMVGTGIMSSAMRLAFVREAQRCGRLGRIIHQLRSIATCIHEVSGKVTAEDVAAFKPLYLMAEVQLKDAVLSILRGDEKMAYGVQRMDDDLDARYLQEMENIYRQAADSMFLDFRTGTSLLFILRSIERIGDHAKQLAIPSFHLLER